MRKLRDEISDKKTLITTVTKGIPFNKIEVRPQDQLPKHSGPQGGMEQNPLLSNTATAAILAAGLNPQQLMANPFGLPSTSPMPGTFPGSGINAGQGGFPGMGGGMGTLPGGLGSGSGSVSDSMSAKGMPQAYTDGPPPQISSEAAAAAAASMAKDDDDDEFSITPGGTQPIQT